ncbi:MAG: hypothetical protein ACFCBU_00170 [Cyanophyceae cyanobacterium]
MIIPKLLRRCRAFLVLLFVVRPYRIRWRFPVAVEIIPSHFYGVGEWFSAALLLRSPWLISIDPKGLLEIPFLLQVLNEGAELQGDGQQ